MSANFYELLKYAATGIASPDMTYYDRMRASTLMGGVVQTLTGIPPLSFKAGGKPLISWSMKGNGSQQGTPTPDAPIQPTFCGVRTGNLWDEDYTGANINAIYRSVFVGDGTFTLSTTFQINSGITDIFLLPGIATSGISSSTNGAYAGKDITAQSIDGYVTIAYRKNARTSTGAIDKCKTMLNSGSTPLPYEPYGYKIPLTCAGQTVPVYLGQVQTVRKVKKLVLDGTENWRDQYNGFTLSVTKKAGYRTIMCTHYREAANFSDKSIYCSSENVIIVFDNSFATLTDFKTFLETQYAAGTPVVIWYVLASPETGIVNEPLMRIGDYADELTTTTPIPTAKGSNTLSVDTTVQPSEVSITGNIKPTT